MESSPLRLLCLILSAGAILLGGAGMVMSFVVLASASMADITAGSSGFIAGSVLIGSGLVSLSLIASRKNQARQTGNPFRSRDVA